MMIFYLLKIWEKSLKKGKGLKLSIETTSFPLEAHNIYEETSYISLQSPKKKTKGILKNIRSSKFLLHKIMDYFEAEMRWPDNFLWSARKTQSTFQI